MNQSISRYILWVGFAAALIPADGSGQMVERGRLLYGNHCVGCHESVVHVRGDHRVDSAEALRSEVSRWAVAERLPWSGEEIDAIFCYLGTAFYDLELPPPCGE